MYDFVFNFLLLLELFYKLLIFFRELFKQFNAIFILPLWKFIKFLIFLINKILYHVHADLSVEQLLLGFLKDSLIVPANFIDQVLKWVFNLKKFIQFQALTFNMFCFFLYLFIEIKLILINIFGILQINLRRITNYIDLCLDSNLFFFI